MKILFLTQVLPYPLDAGPKVRAYYVLRYLAKKHDVSLVSFVRPGDPPESYAHLKEYCQELITIPIHRSRWRDGVAFVKSLVHQEPFLITRDQVPQMHKALEALATPRIRAALTSNTFDAIHADQLWMAAYALGAAQAAGRNVFHPPPVDRGYRRFIREDARPHLVLDQHNAVYLIPQRLATDARNPWLRRVLRREARQMARYEARTCSQFDQVIWVSEQDLAAVGKISSSSTGPRPVQALENRLRHPNQADLVIPICIDPIQEAEFSTRLAPSGEANHLLFLGGMHWPPNADGVNWFIRTVLPHLQAANPHIKFHMVGKSPPAEALRTPGVIAPGYVPDLDPIWKQADIFIVPLRAGGGMRVKILDAWARGLPVVSTSIGAEGLVCQDGKNILIADTPETFLEKIFLLNNDPELRARLAWNGRRTVETRYDWKTIYSAFDQIYPPEVKRQ